MERSSIIYCVGPGSRVVVFTRRGEAACWGAVTSPQRHTSQEETPPDHSPLSGSPASICDPSGRHFGL